MVAVSIEPPNLNGFRSVMADMNLRANVPVFLKKLIWEIKYGFRNYAMPVAPGDVVSHLSRLPNHARILELGCGGGSLLKALREAGWQGHYCGSDISEAAIRGASKIEKNGNSSWIVSDIESFASDLKWDVIALVEVIYYVKIDQVSAVLNRAVGMLNPGGYLLLRIHDFSKHHQYVDAIQGLGSRVEHTGALLVIFPSQKGPLATAAH
jgi:2-polyprenyl-3-methyl-5-hydroxy-6-metoxy-1,4-benzoquinol methylase